MDFVIQAANPWNVLALRPRAAVEAPEQGHGRRVPAHVQLGGVAAALPADQRARVRGRPHTQPHGRYGRRPCRAGGGSDLKRVPRVMEYGRSYAMRPMR